MYFYGTFAFHLKISGRLQKSYSVVSFCATVLHVSQAKGWVWPCHWRSTQRRWFSFSHLVPIQCRTSSDLQSSYLATECHRWKMHEHDGNATSRRVQHVALPNVRMAARCQGWNGQKVRANLFRVAHSAKIPVVSLLVIWHTWIIMDIYTNYSHFCDHCWNIKPHIRMYDS